MLSVLVWIFLGLIALLLLGICTPFRIGIRVCSDPRLCTNVDISPFGGIIGRLPIFDSTKSKGRKRSEGTKPSKKKARRTRKKFSLMRVSFPDVLEFVAQLLGKFRLEDLTLRGEFGLNDPADTGQLFGQLTPLTYGFGCKIDVKPNFENACWHGEASARIRVIPISLLVPVSGFVWRMIGPRT